MIAGRAGELILAVGLMLTIASRGEGQIARAFVATYGNDDYGCGPGAPCRTFARAHSVVLTGGEIVVLNSGGYGPMTITKPLSVSGAPGIHAGITVFNGTGIAINAPASAHVTVRGLNLVGLGGDYGIWATNLGSLRVEDCTFYGLDETAINWTPSGVASLYVDGCTFMDSYIGVRVRADSAAQNAMISNTSFASGGNAFTFAGGSIVALVNRCTVNATGVGVQVGAAAVRANLVDCVLAENYQAITTAGTAGSSYTRVSNCTITDNNIALTANAGSELQSFGNNYVTGNGSNETFTATIVRK